MPECWCDDSPLRYASALTLRAADMSLIPGTRIGSYDIVGKLGAGGMGEVYRARDSRLNRDIAIKVLPFALCH